MSLSDLAFPRWLEADIVQKRIASFSSYLLTLLEFPLPLLPPPLQIHHRLLRRSLCPLPHYQSYRLRTFQMQQLTASPRRHRQ